MSDAQFSKAERSFFDRFFALNPQIATYVGLHDPYDRLMPDGGLSSVQEGVVILKDFLETVESLAEDRLSPSRRIDKEVIRYAYDMARFRYEEHRLSHRNPEALAEFMAICFLMLVREYAPLPQRLESIAARLWGLPAYLEDFRGRFEGGRTVRLWTQIAIEMADGAEPFFNQLTDLANKTEERLGQIFEKAAAKARTALETHRLWLAELLKKSSPDWSLGREKFEHLVSIRQLGLSVAEMLEFGHDQLRRTQSRQKEIAREIGADLSVEEAMARVMDDGPEDFAWAMNYLRDAMEKAREFILENDLLTVPVGGGIRVHETPAFLRNYIPFAAIFPPGKFDKVKEGVCLLTRPADRKVMRSHFNRSELTNMVLHETYPGHFVQASVSNFASETHLLASAPETVEGWAHYSEQFMTEKGFMDSPEMRLVQVRAMTWRAARLIVDVGLACHDMNPEEGARFLVKEAGLDRKSAVSEVRRSTLQPGRALSYLVGKHLIGRMKAHQRTRLGDRFSEKSFHDTICANGYLPYALLTKVFEAADR